MSKFVSKDNAERVLSRYAEEIKTKALESDLNNLNSKFGPIEILKADYDLLSQEQKAAHRYIITDYPDGEVVDLSAVTVNGNPIVINGLQSDQVSRNCKITLEPIQFGSGDPSPSNERVIKGYKHIDLKAVHKNVWGNGALEPPTNQEPYWWWKIPFTKNLKMQLVDKNNGADVSGCYIGVFVDPSDAHLGFHWCLYNGVAQNNPLGTQTEHYIVVYPNNQATLDKIFARYNIITVVEDDELSPFEAYDPANEIVINLNNTIYGGTLDVESGELVVTHKRVDMGSLAWSKYGGYFYANTDDKKYGTNNVLCDSFKYDGGSLDVMPNYSCRGNDNNSTIYLIDNDYSTAEQLIAGLSGKYAVYELATPITYHLTPHQVKLLQGANVVTTNGTSISLTYRNGEVASLADLTGLADSVEDLSSGLSVLDNLENAGRLPDYTTVNNGNYTLGALLYNILIHIDVNKITNRSCIIYNNEVYRLSKKTSTPSATYIWVGIRNTTDLCVVLFNMEDNGNYSVISTNGSAFVDQTTLKEGLNMDFYY